MRKRFLLLIGVFGAAVVAASFNFGNNQASATVPGTNTLLNASASGVMGSYGASNGEALSADGRFAAFVTSSNNIVSGDTNATNDVFVRNLTTNITTRVNISSSGVQADHSSQGTVISETGRYIVFSSNASNLIDSTTEPATYNELYLRDTQTNTTSLLSQTTSGTLANADIQGAAISSDGQFVLFRTLASNLGTTITNSGLNTYMLDRSNGSFTVIQTKTDGTLPDNSGIDTSPNMSCDGSLVVFAAKVNLITTPPYSSHDDVYLLDRRAGNKLTDLTLASNGAAGFPTISCNGDYIGFTSDAYNLDPILTTNPNGYYHGYVYNRVTGTYSLVDKSSSGAVGNTTIGCSALSGPACITVSNNGVVAFASHATNLVSSGSSLSQIYLQEPLTGTTQVLSQDSSGTAGNGVSSYPMIDNAGKVTTYLSTANSLTSITPPTGDTNVYVSLTGF